MRGYLFLLAYRAPTHKTTGTPASMMSALLFPHPIQDQPMIDLDLVEWLHGIRYYASQPLKVVSNGGRDATTTAGFLERDQVWFYHPTWTRGRSLKLQLSWCSLQHPTITPGWSHI